MRWALPLLVMSGCHCGETCVVSHQEHVDGFFYTVMVGKTSVINYIPPHEVEVCDEWGKGSK